MTVAFDLASLGELQFIEPVLWLLTERNPDLRIGIVHRKTDQEEFEREYKKSSAHFVHWTNDQVRGKDRPAIDLFVTSEQYNLGLHDCYSVCLFHGQPSKGLTFQRHILEHFDAFFLYGPLQRLTFDEFLSDEAMTIPGNLTLFDIGYSKSDAVLNGTYHSHEVRRELNLPTDKPTILYAPAFNEGASLRESGPEIIAELCLSQEFNVLVKLPIECWNPLEGEYANGGWDWFKIIQKHEAEYPNLRLCRDLSVDPYLACADVLITDISSVSFEFLALEKPVVFFDTPKFFLEVLPKMRPGIDGAELAQRTTANGGKEFGPLAHTPAELSSLVHQVLADPTAFPWQKERLRDFLLYHRGSAALEAVKTLETLLQSKARSRRRSSEAMHRRIWRRVKRLSQLIRTPGNNNR